jgi:hypothetical protein
MNIQYVSPDELGIAHSRYRFLTQPGGDFADPHQRLLTHSLKTFGVLNPLLVHQLADGSLQLVDGFKRAAYAIQTNEETVPCHVLSHISVASVLDLLLLNRFTSVDRSPASRIRFICFALASGVPREVVTERYLPMLQFEGHEKVLQKCEKVGALPEEVLAYLEEKRFSLKQCVHITRHPSDLLEQLFLWKKDLALTASIVEELLDNIKDILRAGDGSLADFIADTQVQDILRAPSLSPNEKTKALRQLVKRMRFPILTTVNDKIETMVSDLHLPPAVNLHWDRSLEKKEVAITINVSSLDMWSDAVRTVTKESVDRQLGAILEEL